MKTNTLKRRLIILIALIIVLCQSTLWAQNWDWESVSQKGDNSVASGTAIDNDGNVYVVGDFKGPLTLDPSHTLNDGGKGSVFLAKYSSSGILLWVQQSKPQSALNDGIAKGIVIDKNNNIYITGSITDTMIFGENPATVLKGYGGGDVFVAKYSSAGDLLWAKNGGTTLWDEPSDIAVTDDGYVYVTGFLANLADQDPATVATFDNLKIPVSGHQVGSFFMVAYDPNGNVRWGKSSVINDYGASTGVSIDVDQSGAVYTTGTFWASNFASNNISFDNIKLTSSSTNTSFLVKYNSNGLIIQAKVIAQDGINLNSLSFDNKTNEVVVVGAITGAATLNGVVINSNDGTRSLIARLNSISFKTNSYWWFGITKLENYAVDSYIDDYGSLYITGFYTGNNLIWGTASSGVRVNSKVKAAYVAKYNASYVLLWAREFEASGWYDWTGRNDILKVSSNGFNSAIAGVFQNSISFPKSDGSGFNNYTNTGGSYFVATLNEIFFFKFFKTDLTDTKDGNTFTLSPNPAADGVSVNFNGKEEYTLVIRNMKGEMEKEMSGNSFGTQYIDISSLPAGIYLVEIKSGDTLQTKKLVVTK